MNPCVLMEEYPYGGVIGEFPPVNDRCSTFFSIGMNLWGFFSYPQHYHTFPVLDLHW